MSLVNPSLEYDDTVIRFLQEFCCQYNIDHQGQHNQNRVRGVIKHMNFTVLNKGKILPPPMFTKVPKKGGNFPKIVKRGEYSWFGFYIDFYIRDLLTSKTIPTQKSLIKVYNQTKYMGGLSVSVDELVKEFDYYMDIGLWILSEFHDVNIIEIEPEISYETIVGHPDLIIDDTIYDIKMTGLFGRMRTDTILQLLCYYCLAKQLKRNIKYIGLVLPAQKIVERIDISSWKWQPFWDAMVAGTESKVKQEEKFDPILMSEMDSLMYNIGTHIPKIGGSVLKSLEKYGVYNHRPYQIFITGNRGGDIKISEKDIKKTIDLVTKKDIKYFVHTPYTINLCHKENSMMLPKYKNGKQIECNYTHYHPQKMLKQQLKYSRKLGALGAVVHCGMRGKQNVSDALENMYENVVVSSKKASERCPLLIETGHGVEILSDVYDLAQFYNSLPETVKQVTAICVDTCHVFAAGYQPMDAIGVLDEFNVPIKLFHFNDSKYPFDSKKDGHVRVGTGRIELQQMIDVAKYAFSKNIPLVTE